MDQKAHPTEEYFEKRRQELQRAIQQQETLNRTRLAYGCDAADSAMETFERTKSMAVCLSLKTCLQQHEEAERRFLHGSYGRCQKCGEPIDLDRLEALPAARFCYECQKSRERARKRSYAHD